MKIVSFLAATLLIAGVANAQTQKNDYMVGGSFRMNTAKNSTQLSFTPNVGLFVVNNLALGGNLDFDYSKAGDTKVTTFGIGPFARYYFTTETQTIRPLVHANFNYISSKSKIGTTPAITSTNTGMNYFVGGGAAAFISNNVSIDAVMGYDHTKYKDFNGSGGFAFTLGFQVYINKSAVDKIRGK